MHGTMRLSDIAQFLRDRMSRGPNISKQHKRKRNDGKADTAIIARAMQILDRGHFSRFEYEGALRHGLRSVFCLDGMTWPAADTRAAAIIAKALRQLGISRPNWLEGQPEWTQDGFTPTTFYFCQRCGSPLSSEGQETQKYCSHLCRQAAHAELHRRLMRDFGEAETLAIMAARGEQRMNSTKLSHIHACEGCGTPFTRSWRPGAARFCSNKCSGSRKYKLPVRPCGHCQQQFTPARANAKWCSPSCKGAAMKAYMQAYNRAHSPPPPERPCAVCSRPFCPARSDALFCSHACNSKAYRQRQRGNGARGFHCESTE
jgi:hypothetical protein